MYSKLEFGIFIPYQELILKIKGSQTKKVVNKTKKIKIKYELMKKRIKNILTKNWFFFVLLLIGIFLRIYRLEEFITFLGDQGRDAIIIKRIITFEDFPALGPVSSIGQVFLGPFFYYLMAPFLALFRLNPVGLAFGSAFYSIISVIFAYFILKKIDWKTANLFLVLTTFSWGLIHNARFSWNPNLLPYFSFFTLYFTSLFFKKNLFFPFLAGTFFSFSTQLHYLALFLAPTLILFFLINYKKILEKPSLFAKKITYFFIGFLIFYLPLILFDLKNQFLNTKNFIKIFSEKEIIQSTSFYQRFQETLTNFFNFTFNSKIDYFLSFTFFIILFIYFFRKNFFQKKPLFQLVFLSFFVFILGFSTLSSFRHFHYYNAIYLNFFVILAVFFAEFFSINLLTKILVFAFLLFFINQNRLNYPFRHPQGNFQTKIAQKIAKSIVDNNPKIPYQIVPIPFTEMDGHIRYYLEIMGKRPLAEESPQEGKELYILCYEKECDVLNHPQWQIAAFKNKKIDKIWKVDRVKIYKIIHEK